jgi:transitional endoplasmic reticulum ATPase
VFLSYAHEPAARAYLERLAEHLTVSGVPVWFDHGIETGDRWESVLRSRIESCAAVLVLMTAGAEDSSWVTRELTWAEFAGKPVLPLLLGDRPLFSLADRQYEDVTGGRLPSPSFVARVKLLVRPALAEAVRPDPAPVDPAELAAPDPAGRPASLTMRRAVFLAHSEQIEIAAEHLRDGLSVIVRCDKALTAHLRELITSLCGRDCRTLSDRPGAAQGRPAALVEELERRLSDGNEVLVVSQLDMLLRHDSSEHLVDLLFEYGERTLLAFSDSAEPPEPGPLAERFVTSLDVTVTPTTVRAADGRWIPLARALIRAEEAEMFGDVDEMAVTRVLRGFNVVRARQALRSAFLGGRAEGTGDLLHRLRSFGGRPVAGWEVPTATFEQIGGYSDVKQQIWELLAVMRAVSELDFPRMRDLVPPGLVLHGPPGVGKRLFSNAIAAQLDAEYKVVSGPELLVGTPIQRRSALRTMIEQACRVAPAVLVLDELDAIAGRPAGGGEETLTPLLIQAARSLPVDAPVLIIGITHRLDLLDPALFGQDRFKAIRIGLPDEYARRVIAMLHARYFDVEVDERILDLVARATEGLSGDEIRGIFRQALVDRLVFHRSTDAEQIGRLVGAVVRRRRGLTAG